MDKGQVKNFIIVLLLVVNLFFLFTVLIDKVEAGQVRSEAAQHLIAVLGNNGISLSDADMLNTEQLNQQSFKRDMSAEKRMVSAVLGRNIALVDQGGSLFYYESENGQATFSGTGKFDIRPAHNDILVDDDPIVTALEYLKKMGLSSSREYAETELGEGLNVVTLLCTLDGSPVFNCSVKFTFSEQSLLLISGTRPLDALTSENSRNTLDLNTILMRFLEMTHESGQVFSEIEVLQAGYSMASTSVSGDCTMTPVWRIVTNVGTYDINGITGKVETINA